MSDPSKDNAFQTASWHRFPAKGSKTLMTSVPAGQGGARGGFEAISAPKKKLTASQEFVSPYVSEEKLRQLNASFRKPEEVSEPEPDLEEIAREAYEKGFSQGEAAGLAAGQQKAKEIVGQIQRALSDVNDLWQHLLVNYETQLIRLVCGIAEKVVYAEVEIDHEVVKRAILNAFSVIPEPIGVTIEVNPKDYEYIETIKEDFFNHVSSLKDVSVLTSPSVARGGCNIFTRAGQVDATLESRFEAVRKSLLEANGRSKG
ncbi:MAG: FliH/SctL family protein [Pseudomonadota bacterium]